MEAQSDQFSDTADAARLDIKAKGFSRAGKDAYFYGRITNPLSSPTMKATLSSFYDRDEVK